MISICVGLAGILCVGLSIAGLSDPDTDGVSFFMNSTLFVVGLTTLLRALGAI
jgi:hypothetical protein